MIHPTPGRIVWFHPNGITLPPNFAYSDSEQPLAATIAYVHSDRMVNLFVIDQNGMGYSLTSVTLLQDDDATPGAGSYAEWMPYQKGQAAKSNTIDQNAMDEACRLAFSAKELFLANDSDGGAKRLAGLMIQRAEQLLGGAAGEQPAAGGLPAIKASAKLCSGECSPGPQTDSASPTVTLEQIENLIVSAQYHVIPGTTVTVCCLELRNGFNVIGESACASLDNFNAEKGRTYAREKAIEKIWPLEGYLLKQRIYEATLAGRQDVGLQ
ncbi:Gp49 family protein [Azotobacter bryophylli]|uniref:Gp49 family protein n=1 Tax=Azotobacter bryophylli TaxID=1986537 RepID=A0ABV7B1Q5_9GAMM